MQEIGYTFKVWFSGLLLTPVIYSILLALLSNNHIPPALGSIIATYVIPYTLVVSIWMGLGVFCTLTVFKQHEVTASKIKSCLMLVTFAMIFTGFVLLHQIRETLSYNGNFVLATAYSLSSILFIWLYEIKLIKSKTAKEQNKDRGSIREAVLYSIIVSFLTFLLSVPLSLSIWYCLKTFHPGTTVEEAFSSLMESYDIQLIPSIAYLITVFLIALTAINLDLTEKKGKLVIMLFACPVALPVYFYYLLFSGGLINYPLFEVFTLVLPAILTSAGVIWLINIKILNKKKTLA